MDNILDYKKLYALQDEVFAHVFHVEREFYLTGGTCLSRFYVEKRYSDDLDFFANASPRYSFAVKNIQIALQKYFKTQVLAATQNFSRFVINDILQLDFINDVAFRYKDVVISKEKYLIDNIENILSNKITAIIGRDNPKDVFDIVLIDTYYPISWNEILQAAHEKAVFTHEELLVRLKTFPLELLGRIKVTDTDFLESFEQNFSQVISKIEQV